MNIYLETYLVGCLINAIYLSLVYFFDKEEFDKWVDKLSTEHYLDRTFVYKLFFLIGISISWILLIAYIEMFINKIKKNK